MYRPILWQQRMQLRTRERTSPTIVRESLLRSDGNGLKYAMSVCCLDWMSAGPGGNAVGLRILDLSGEVS